MSSQLEAQVAAVIADAQRIKWPWRARAERPVIACHPDFRVNEEPDWSEEDLAVLNWKP